MNYRKLFFVTIACAAVCILLIAAFSYFMRERKFNYDKLLSGISSREYNSVIAAKQPYNAAILGSSLSQGFHCSEFDAAFKTQSLKLTFSAANLAEIKFMADYAYKFRKLDYVMMDFNLFSVGWKVHLDDMPMEYYTADSGFLKFKRAFSINSFADGMEFFRDWVSGEIKNISRDELYDWNLESPCGEKYFVRAMVKGWKKFTCNQAFIDNAEKNIKNYFIPLVEAHPETRFILFYPPYSMMFYKDVDHEYYIKLKEKVTKLLLGRKNVELHDFQTEFPVIENFENYKDLTHYSGRINAWMLKQIPQKTHLVTGENLQKRLDLLSARMKNYDYQTKYDELKRKYPRKKK